MAVEAGSREEAVRMLQGAMTEESIAAHMKQHHRADEPVPSVAQTHAMIEQLVKAS
jgi:hypothetical protein